MSNEVPVTVSMPSVSISLGDFAMMISDSVDQEHFPELVKDVDLFYADFDVSERILEHFLDSLGSEVKALYGEDSENAKDWNEASSTLKEIMKNI